MAHVLPQPPGVFSLVGHDRKQIFRVTSGDSWMISANLYNPCDNTPATSENTLVTVCLSETQFDKPLWIGTWDRGIREDANRPGLCWISFPSCLTKTLRRGSYQFSIRVSDLLKSVYRTEGYGSFLVEYAPTSDIHEIPYKNGSGDSGEVGYHKIGENFYLKSYVSDGVQHYVKQVMEYDPEIGWGATWIGDYVLVDGKFKSIVV